MRLRRMRAVLTAALSLSLAAAMTMPATALASWAPWVKSVDGKKVQYSTYGPYEGENITATGKRITNSTKYIAVPVQMVVSKKTWKSHKSRAYRLTHFYYHEKIKLKVGKRTVVATVEDCGGFLGFGGSRYERLFDITPAVFNTLRVGKGTGTLSWTYMK